MVTILIFVFFLSCTVAQLRSVTTESAPWSITGRRTYNEHNDQTVFSYTVKTYANGKVLNFLAGVPSCPELQLKSGKIVKDSNSGLRGVRMVKDVDYGREWTYTVVLQGYIENDEIPYAIEGLKNTGARREHQYSTGSVIGPKCEKIPKITCGISREQYSGECIGDTVRIALVSTSQYYTRLQWSTDYAGCSFSQTDTATPYITFHGPVCDSEFKVKLEVWGPGHQHEVCYTTITATDTSPPTFTGLYGPTDLNVPCDDIPAPLHIVAKDTCDNDVQVSFSEEEEMVEYGPYSIFRTWIAVDDCGNKATYTQKVIVSDSEPPKLIGVPDDEEIDCDVEVDPCIVVASDNCDEVTVEHTSKVIEGTCVDSWQVVRTWIAEDSSHNSVTAHQTVTVSDDENPVLIGIPDDITVDCESVPDNISPTAVDNCMDDIFVSSSERIFSGSCESEYQIRREYAVVDECGNHVSDTWVVDVIDNTPPRLSGAGGTEDHPCDNIPVPCVVEAIDNCATYSGAITPIVTLQDQDCPGNYTMVYLWSVTDFCGNTASVSKTIRIYDDVPPRFTLHIPQFLKATCEHYAAPVMHATDNCGTATVETFPPSKDQRRDYGVACAYNYDLFRSWVATDECGHTASQTQTVNVIDDVPPVLVGGPPDMTIACDGDYDMAEVPVNAFDNCKCVDDVQFIRLKKFASTCEYSFKQLNRWSVQDCCGHLVEHFQTVTVYDDIPPHFNNVPGSAYIAIEDMNNLPSHSVTAEDNCDNHVTVPYTEKQVPGSCEHNYIIVREWDAVDDCGNAAHATQSISCHDHTPPDFENEDYIDSYECPIPAVLPIIVVTDNGGGYLVDLQESQETIQGTCEDEYLLLRHMIATDPCGNIALKTYTIHVFDTQPPNWLTDPCLDEKYTIIDTAEAYSGLCQDDMQANDICAGPVSVEFDEKTVFGSCETEYLIVRSWFATDNCGNSIKQSRSIDVKDLSPPTLIDVPPHAQLDCTEDFVAAYTAPTAVDYGYTTHLDVTFAFKIVAGQPCMNNLTAVKCWTVHDCVGHSAQACQTVSVRDTTPPQFAYVPPDSKAPCDNIPDAFAVTATDDCGHANVAFHEDKEAGTCLGEYLIIRTWVATDECDLSSTHVQTITVVDEHPPVFDFVPESQNLDCGTYSRYVAATCSDDCDYKVTIKRKSERGEATCDDAKIDLRIWVCSDDCGNEATAVQTIDFSDTTPPTFTRHPQDVSLPCRGGDVSAIPAPPNNMRCLDNCDNKIAVQFREELVNGYGHQSSVTIRYWKCEDNCGNTAEVQQTITIYDDVPPVVTVDPSYNLLCTEEYRVPNYKTVIDNCDPFPQVDITTSRPYEECHWQYTAEYTFCPYDKSGNYGPCRSTRVTVDDSEPPVWTSPLPPAYSKIPYTSSYGHSDLTAHDECEGDLTVVIESDIQDLSCDNEKRVVYVYTAEDLCGNSVHFTQTILVVDNIPPPLAPLPQDTTIECPDPFPVAATLVSDDAYSYTPLVVDYVETPLESSCEHDEIIVRRWYVQDCAGNFNSHEQTLTILDTGNPVLPEVPQYVNMECEEDEYTLLSAWDECDLYVDVSFDSNRFNEDGCSYDVARSWVAQDDCGNQALRTQTIHISDDTKPEVYGAPLSVTVDNHNIPGVYKLTCNDNCASEMFESTFTETTDLGSCEDEYNLHRKWVCEDACGLKAEYEQIIYVIDAESPVLSYCPQDITVQMGLVPEAPVLTATDGQVYGEVDVTHNEEEEIRYAGHIQRILYRSWLASDNCANEVICKQTITVIDTIPPIIPDVPRDYYVDCDDYVIVNWGKAYHEISEKLYDSVSNAPGVNIDPYFPDTITNHYDLYPSIEKTKVIGSCKNEYTLRRTWTATDHAGNSLSDTQIITVVDDRPPTWDVTVERSITENCKHTPPPEVTCNDNCEYSVYSNIHEERGYGTCPNDYTIYRSWTCDDACGNGIVQKQTVYVVDEEPPYFGGETIEDDTVECTEYESMPTPPTLTCHDACAGDITPVFSATKHAHTCADSWIIIRTWECSDYCGHVSYKYQTITIEDTVSPELGGEDIVDIDVECEQSPPYLAVTATDACADYVDVQNDVYGQSLGYENAQYVQTFSAYDHCGNQVNKSRTITVVDTHDPVISPKPPSIAVPCDEYGAYLMPEPHCEDNCGGATLTRDIQRVDGTCEGSYELVVEWTCEDQHGRFDDHLMTVSVYDNERPSLSTHDVRITVQCDDVPPTASVTASDNCDEVSVLYTEVKEYPGYIMDSSATAPDFDDSSTYTTPIDDSSRRFISPNNYYSISPMILPATRLYGKMNDLNSCAFTCYMSNRCAGAQLWAPIEGGKTFCYHYDEAAICDIQKEAYKVPETQSDVTYRGTGYGSWVILTSAICEFIPEPVHLCDNYDIIRTWSAEDNCGNSITHTHRIHVIDNEPPMLVNVPDHVTWPCESHGADYLSAPASAVDTSAAHGITAPTAVDNCSPHVKVHESVVYTDRTCPSNYQTLWTWVATDECGSTAEATMTVTKWDILPPTLSYVAHEEELECTDPLPDPPTVTATDLCGDHTLVLDTEHKGNTCNYDFVYTWTATDECGNAASAVQINHVADTLPPVVSGIPDDFTLDCDDPKAAYNHEDPTLIVTPTPTVVDACGPSSLNAFISKTTLDCPSNQQWIIRWIGSDECGNKVEDFTTVTIVDNDGPTISGVPASDTVECDLNYVAPPVVAVDNCGDAVVKFSETVEDFDCDATGIYHKVYRVWMAVDDCGHTEYARQTIVVVDEEDPVIIVPEDVTIHCDAQVPQILANGNDDCGNPTVTSYEETIEGSCEDNYKIVKTFSAVDRCGNTVHKSATVSVEDSRKPTINGVPADATVECENIPDVPKLRIEDDCSYPTPHFDEVSTRDGYACNDYNLTRSWWVVDNCGNRATAEYQIVVEDTTDPELLCSGMDDCIDVEIECEIYPPLPIIVAKDNCYEHLEIDFVTTPIPGSCEHEHEETRTWTTHDNCGHTATLNQKVTYYDRTPPVLEGYIEDQTIECPGYVEIPQVTANDNCDYALEPTYTKDTIDGVCHQLYVEYRKWVATDICGNSDFVTQTVTVVDTTPPVLNAYANNLKVECDKLETAWNGPITAQDECEYDMSVKFTEKKIDGSCEHEFTLIRRWTATDCSGNTAEHSQTVYVEDTIPPYFLTSPPADETISQEDQYSGTFVDSYDAASVEAADNCAYPTVKYVEVNVPIEYDCDYMYYRIRTWSIHDDCGHTDEMVQTIDMVDTTEPELEAPEHVTVECDSVPPPCDVKVIGDAYAATLTFSEVTIAGTCVHEYKLVRTWVATDCADNAATVTQTVTVEDFTDPVFTRYPADVTIECDCDELGSVPTIDAVDNCDLGGDEVQYEVETEHGDCEFEYDIIRFWYASDACGNRETHTQTVTVEDTYPPLFCDDFCDDDYVDAYQDISCDSQPEVTDPLVKDDCDEDPELVELTADITTADDCEEEKTIVYSWKATDNCGNSDYCSRTITIVDDNPPACDNRKYCYPINMQYGTRPVNEYAVYHLPAENMMQCNDNCASDEGVTITLLSCNSTHIDGFDDTHCHWFAPSNRLYVNTALIDSTDVKGLYYYVWFLVTDPCGNEDTVSRTIWIPQSQWSYEDAVARGDCAYGMGTDHYVESIPMIVN